MIGLKNYQKEAVENLSKDIERCLRSSEPEVVIFQAPTGSGKTVVTSQLLEKVVQDNPSSKFSFIWISVRSLHAQSKEKLEQIYEDSRLLRCSYFDDLEDRQIDENEILFVNWHSINKKDINLIVRENEQDNNLSKIIENTKEEGRTIILVIDESHHTAKSEKSRELVDIISPSLTLEVSATPHLRKNICSWVKVNLSDVKAEEMIKSEVSINPGFLDMKKAAKSSDELILGQALEMREKLRKRFKKSKTSVNPLVLVQLPDKKSNLINKKDDVIQILQDSYNITEENGKLAVWLSEQRTETLANIEKNDNEVEVLVFKQAIALGWDCPRAAILVVFRESKSFTFTIQTIGRIMRMPELKYYDDEMLNKGFIFTNLPHIEITEDYAKDYLTIFESRRDEKLYDGVNIPSVHFKRQRERTRLSGEFVRIFKKIAKEYKLKSKLNARPSKIVRPIIADGKIVNIDKLGEVKHKGKIDVGLTQTELQGEFDRFITQNCKPFAPADSSDRMKTAIYNFFKENYKMKKFDPQAQRIVLGAENVQSFVDIINLAKDAYRSTIVTKLSEVREREDIPKWEIPRLITYTQSYKKTPHKKSIMKPFFVRKPSKPELLFMKKLEESKNVKWWFKNGESDKKYFAVSYLDEKDKERAFYVDFIVKFKDNSIGLFDTKSGMTAKDATTRAEGLQQYLSKLKGVWGGIVVESQGSLRVNDNKKYHYDPKNLSDWKILEL